jgi:uncharacterized membrane protein
MLDKVVNLGTVLDKNMTLSSHINEMCKKSHSKHKMNWPDKKISV